MINNPENERFEGNNQMDNRRDSNYFLKFLVKLAGIGLGYKGLEFLGDLIKSGKVKQASVQYKDASAALQTWDPNTNQDAKDVERDGAEPEEVA